MIAEPGDDIKNLDIPPEESSQTSSREPKLETSGGSQAPSASTPAVVSGKRQDAASKPLNGPQDMARKSVQGQKQDYPLYPSVAQLLHENGLSKLDAGRIPSSGPNGRLLKGDVLAYLGTIKSSYPAELSARITKLAHLDLDNIRIAPPPSLPRVESKESKEELAPSAPVHEQSELTVSVNLRSVQEVRERIHKVLGIDVPISTFIARAVEASNLDLPPLRAQQPAADDLFNDILGLDRVPRNQPGFFVPRFASLPTPQAQSMSPEEHQEDIIDILTSARPRPAAIEIGLGFDSSR